MPAGATTGAGGAVVYNGLGGDATTTTPAAGAQATSGDTKKNGSQMALDIGRSYGFAVVFAGLFAGFALV